MELTVQETIIRLGISALLGGFVGIERERLNWVAGMRTHMLVCVGSTLIMLVSMFGFTDILGQKDVVLDPSRVAAQVVSGIGFLGAGTIFFWKKEIIRGLTTAAALWAVAGIGLAIGGGMYIAGVAATALVLIILALMKPIERIIFKNEELLRHTLIVSINQKIISLKELYESLEDEQIKVLEMKTGKSKEKPESPDYIDVYIMGEGTRLLEFADKIKQREGVNSLTFS